MRLLAATLAVVGALLFSAAGPTWAGAFDGEWEGKYIHRECWDAEIYISIEGNVVSGDIKYVPDSNFTWGQAGELKGQIDDTGKFDTRSSQLRSLGGAGGWKSHLSGVIEDGIARVKYYEPLYPYCDKEISLTKVGATLATNSETDPAAKAERIRKEEEARKLAEAERIQKEKKAQKLAKAERKRTEEERRLAEQKMIVAQEAATLIPEIEAFAKTSPRQIDFLLLLELFHKAKPVNEGEWSEDLRDDYLALRKLVINDPEFVVFQEAAKVRQAEERRIRTVALRTEVIRAAAFLKHFVVENFSSPSAPLALSAIGSLEEVLSSEDLETLQAAAANFSSFIDRESLQVQLSYWESEFGDSVVADADEEAPTKQVAEAVESQDTASQTASDIPLEDIFSSFVAIKNANVRELPTAKSVRVATLSKGSEVTALGKVKGKNWYLVARDGKELGYVFGSLMAEAETVAPLAPVAKNPDAVAVVIGNKSYIDAVPEVKFAHNDADAIKRYLINTLGYREGNIIDARDTTKGELEAIFGNKNNYKGRLFNYIRANESDVTVFYSGHGVPDTKSRRGYLLPVDADPDIINITGYPLDVMLENLSKMPARSMSVFLDACFSGDSPEGMIIRATSGISVTAKIPQTDAKMVVITASQGDQYASWDEDAEHGLFTKHLLEALNGTADTERYGNGDGEITVGEVKNYLDREMTYQARRRFNREQEASVSGDVDSVLITYLSGRATKHIDVQRKQLDLELGDYHALVIGNNDYGDMPKLKTAVADAEAISEVLEDRYGFSVTKLINATRYDLIGAMSELRATLSYDTNLLIYYAGHGIVDPVTERGYWLPVDAKQSSSANWVSNDDITDMLKAIPAQHILVIADSCYSGTLVRAAPVNLETWEDRRDWLKRIAKKRSRTALASGGLEPVADAGSGGHSVFAAALLGALRENSEIIEAQALFAPVRRKVVLNADQTPVYSDIRLAGHDGGEFIFAPQ